MPRQPPWLPGGRPPTAREPCRRVVALVREKGSGALRHVCPLPLSVVSVATAGSDLAWRERALIGFVSPRGIVAALVSSLFALRLGDLELPGAEVLVPLVLILIIAMVMLQSATVRPQAADADPDGVLASGADAVACGVGQALA